MTDRSDGLEADDEPGTDVQSLLDAAADDPPSVPRLLLATACSETGRAVLEAAFAAGWEPIADALWDLSPVEADALEWRCSGYGEDAAAEASATLLHALWQALPLVPDATTEPSLLRDACALDPRLLRHALARGAEGEGDGAWSPVAGFVAEVADRHALARSGDGFAWRERASVKEALLAASPMRTRALAADLIHAHRDAVDEDVLDEVAARFAEPLDFLVALGEADPRLARERAGRPEVERYGERLGHWTAQRADELREPDRLRATAARFLPLERLVDGDDDPLSVAVATAIGRLLIADGRPRTPALVADVLARPEALEGTGRWIGLSLLWAELVQHVAYGHGYEARGGRAGVLARLDRTVETYPEAWRASARRIVQLHGDLGDEVLDRLMLVAARRPDVAHALRDIADGDEDPATRDVACGLVARLDGVFAPGGDLQRWIADSAARAYDGTPFFPNPLTPLTTTWTSAPAVEGALRQATGQTLTRFAGYVRDQGAAVEEHLVGVLLRDLETGLGAVSSRVSAAEARLARTIAIKHRPLHKSLEEPDWGCDVALLVDMDVAGSVKLRTAELVQVKKSRAIGDAGDHTDRWRIDVDQLKTLLKQSDGAVYWLLLADGTVACVPATWLLGLVVGHGALNQETFTASYHEVRSAAIPVEQMLAELLLGTWLGSTREDVVEMAAGERPNMIPRHLLEIVIRSHAD